MTAPAPCSRKLGTITCCYDFHPQTPRESLGFVQTHSPAAGTGWWQIRWNVVGCDLRVAEHEAGRAEAGRAEAGRAGRAPAGAQRPPLPAAPTRPEPGASPLGQEGEEGSRRGREEGRCPKVPPSVSEGQLLTALSADSLGSSSVRTKPAPQTGMGGVGSQAPSLGQGQAWSRQRGPSLAAWLVRGQDGTWVTVLAAG